jgi:hypothetical protein
MPLSPDTLDALESALGAVIDEAGDDPQYAELVSALADAQQASSSIEPAEAETRDGPDDDSSFATAEQRMKDARSAPPEPDGQGEE